MRVRASVAACGLVILAGCGGAAATSTPTDVAPPPPSVMHFTNNPNTPTPTPAGPTAVPLGQAVPTSAGLTLTAVADRWGVASANEFSSPNAGDQWFGVDMKVCNNSDANDPTLGPSDFQVQTADCGVEQPDLFAITSLNPTFPDSQTLQQGACVSGWIIFDAATKPVQIAVSGGSADYYWTT